MSTKKTQKTETQKATTKTTKKAPNAKATEAPTTPALPPTMLATAPAEQPPAKAPAPAKDANTTPTTPKGGRYKKELKETVDRQMFRTGSATGVLFREGSKDWIDRKELVAKVADLTGKEARLVEYMLMWFRQPNHRTNRGRFLVEKNAEKKIRIRPLFLTDAEVATQKPPKGKAAKATEKKA